MKLAELPGWLGRRGMYTPMGINRAMSRAFWRWNHKYMLPKVRQYEYAKLDIRATGFNDLKYQMTLNIINISFAL